MWSKELAVPDVGQRLLVILLSSFALLHVLVQVRGDLSQRNFVHLFFFLVRFVCSSGGYDGGCIGVWFRSTGRRFLGCG